MAEEGKGKQPNAAKEDEGIWKDPRFAHLVSDPRFRNIHKSTKSVKIDKRFKSMFSDEKFKVKYTVDKYGRRVNKTSTDDLEKYYELSSEDEEDEKRKEETELLKESGDVNERIESDEEISEDIKTKLKDLNVDYARGEAPLQSDSSSDDESSEDEEKELFIEHVWGELDNDAPRTEESSRRLAVCNMDWDRIRASDIMVLLNSFLPPGGQILSVRIYPSEYGKQRMLEEEVKGPQELTENQAKSSSAIEDDDSSYDDSDLSNSEREDNEEGDDYHMEKLRQYQLNRLKYYYAVVECNTVRAADKLYAECDGLEYESTATKLDLRFIPDDMTFDDEPKDECENLPDLVKYKPRLFTTTALQQAKVELTWDENDVDRKELNEKLLSGKMDDIADVELRKFVAYSSEEENAEGSGAEVDEEEKDSDEEEGEETEKVTPKQKKKADKLKNGFVEQDVDEELPTEEKKTKPRKKEDAISKYKNLLKDIAANEEQKKKSRIEMEFSWGIDTNGKPKGEKKPETTRKQELTPFEQIIEKKMEKKRARKAQIRQLKKGAQGGGSDSNNDDDEDDDDLPDGIDLNDPYFAEEFANGEFAPPKSKSNKQKKKKRGTHVDEDEDGNAQKESELALLLDDDDNRAHFSLKKIQASENDSKSKKRRKQLKQKKDQGSQKTVDDDFQINVNDDRFSAVFSSHLFNIDPTNPHFKKTKAMETLIEEKLKRKPSADVPSGDAPIPKRSKQEVANNILIKSIKRKVEMTHK